MINHWNKSIGRQTLSIILIKESLNLNIRALHSKHYSNLECGQINASIIQTKWGSRGLDFITGFFSPLHLIEHICSSTQLDAFLRLKLVNVFYCTAMGNNRREYEYRYRLLPFALGFTVFHN